MRPSMRKALLWQLAGVFCYLLGLLLFLGVAIGVYFAEPAHSLANLSAGHMPLLLFSVALLVGGRMISWKYGGEAGGVMGTMDVSRFREPEQSKLAELGYRVPPDPSEETQSDYAYEDGEVRVVCRECGTENDVGFSYCSNCSAELPE